MALTNRALIRKIRESDRKDSAVGLLQTLYFRAPKIGEPLAGAAIELLIAILVKRPGLGGIFFHEATQRVIPRFGELAIDPLLDLLGSGEQGPRSLAARLLGNLDPVTIRVVEALKRAAVSRVKTHPESNRFYRTTFQGEALRALSKTGVAGRTLKPGLERWFVARCEHPNRHARPAAIAALGQLPVDTPGLLDALGTALRSKWQDDRRSAVDSLVQLGEPGFEILREFRSEEHTGYQLALRIDELLREQARREVA